MFQCTYGACVSVESTCNGRVECADGSDEDPQLCVHSRCRLPQSPPHGHYVAEKCHNCTHDQVLKYFCDDNYVLQGSSLTSCHNSTWMPETPTCIPECGKITEEAVPLVVNGHETKYGTWPWQAALFYLQNGNWTFWCGGSLINEYAVITAAHCTWSLNAGELTVILGKYYADYERNDNLTQIKTIKEIVMLAAYQDKTGNYGSDLAVLILSSRVEFSSAVRPVCIDWELDYIDQDLSEGSVGTVAGWGVNENDTFSDKLYKVQLPVVPDQTCITQQSRDFKKYITYTTFCAGYNNGTGVCNGDSGGGLMFSHNGTWTLQGVVSVSPRRRGTSFCDPTKYTIFTKVAMYAKWIKYVLDSNHIN
ncbi:hypothetical protein L9F63_021875 [Diploptera punctata]|uniref:Uncharacterized protein n=1 Tax=Diploptera punctata TaxID=6984 RepID=A0AAD7ZNQ1_DIPPU|nr:hypothetical protein L9F63_021875 [Diploptera punctata]